MRTNKTETVINKKESFNWDSFKNNSGEDYVLFIYLPGCVQKNLHVDVDAMKIKVHCDQPHCYVRSFPLPDNLNIPEVHSSYGDGILKLSFRREKIASEQAATVEDIPFNEEIYAPVLQMALGI